MIDLLGGRDYLDQLTKRIILIPSNQHQESLDLVPDF